MYANDQLGLCFYALVRYSLLFSSEIILKELFASGSVNIGRIISVEEYYSRSNNPLDFVSGIIRHRRIIVKYYDPPKLEQIRCM